MDKEDSMMQVSLLLVFFTVTLLKPQKFQLLLILTAAVDVKLSSVMERSSKKNVAFLEIQTKTC